MSDLNSRDAMLIQTSLWNVTLYRERVYNYARSIVLFIMRGEKIRKSTSTPPPIVLTLALLCSLNGVRDFFFRETRYFSILWQLGQCCTVSTANRSHADFEKMVAAIKLFNCLGALITRRVDAKNDVSLSVHPNRRQGGHVAENAISACIEKHARAPTARNRAPPLA